MRITIRENLGERVLGLIGIVCMFLILVFFMTNLFDFRVFQALVVIGTILLLVVTNIKIEKSRTPSLNGGGLSDQDGQRKS